MSTGIRRRMMILGLFQIFFTCVRMLTEPSAKHQQSAGSALAPAPLDCGVAEQGCLQQEPCAVLYRLLEYCVAEEAVAPLGADARWECLEAQHALQQYRPLQACKCQRGSRREEHCLKVYWTVRFSAYEEYEVSPYEELELNLVRNVEMSHMASIMSASSHAVDGQNQCLKAAQDCGLFEKCGSLRSEYVVACTKRATGSDSGCNRQKCHRALRRFLERVPDEYSFALLFCPCSDPLCGERRRKTIVPSCSFEESARNGEERAEKPNCLSLQTYCYKDQLCRSRFADFQRNCQASSLSPSGCGQESRARCLQAYKGLIGTIMTPNYINNSSTEVSQWCTCEASGNEWQDCQQILNMFSSNTCLRNAISSMGVEVGGGGSPVDSTPPPPASRPPPPPPVIQEQPRVSVQTLQDFTRFESSEDKQKEEEEESQDLNIIPPFSEKDPGMESGARGSHRGAASTPGPLLPLLLWLALWSLSLSPQ
ncbi:GDNF family receptor alpha-3 isoform X1 [Gadus chalcogrammus]|uniref:GDNF family receptor alpha-3 isoform X1 n=1 Tax=Gadus chalcogrammus TaxID=1042646 RepID=UPI0024C464D9|nr:GDNF family receptor alpha-3 isoform X1 [Gadus chalcogrammus]